MLFKKGKDSKSIINNIIIAAIVVLAIVYVALIYGRDLTNLTGDPEKFKTLMQSYGYIGAFVFIGLQVLQVVVAAIPGEVVQIAGGYVYGTVIGTIYSVIGVTIGTVIAFYLARVLGYPIVERFVSKKSLEKFNFLMNSKKSEVAMFILFLVPGIPKDILTYIAGITPVKPVRFFIIITIARLPAMIGSSMIGSNLQKHDYLPVIILSVIAAALFILGIFFRNRIIDQVSRLTSKNKSGESGKSDESNESGGAL